MEHCELYRNKELVFYHVALFFSPSLSLSNYLTPQSLYFCFLQLSIYIAALPCHAVALHTVLHNTRLNASLGHGVRMCAVPVKKALTIDIDWSQRLDGYWERKCATG